MIKNLNKKGFTLIELLAVIVVLAIIMLLAVQAVLPQMEKARKNAFIVEAQAAIEAAKTYTIQQSLSGDVSQNGSNFCVSIGKLVEDNFYDDGGKGYEGYVVVTVDSNGKYDYTITMKGGQYGVSNKKINEVKYGAINPASSVTITYPTGCTTS